MKDGDDLPVASSWWAFPVGAFLAGVVWTAIGGLIVLFALVTFLSIPAFLREKNTNPLYCVVAFGAGFLLVGVQTIRGRMPGILIPGIASAVLGALIVGGQLYAGESLHSILGWSGVALLTAGVLAIRGRRTYNRRREYRRDQSAASSPPGAVGGVPGASYQEMKSLALPPRAPSKEPQRWTTVFELPGRPGLSFGVRLLLAGLLYPAGVLLGLVVVGLWSGFYSATGRTPGEHSNERMVVSFIACVLSAHWLARRVLAPRAWELARRYPGQAPILLLRAFADDQFKMGDTGGVIGPWQRTITFEEILTEDLARLGPVIAVGRPRELVPPTGAARLWLNNDSWQKGIHLLLEECQLIVMVMGRIHGEAGLAWEVEQIKRLDLMSRLVLVMPPVSDREAAARWNDYARLLDPLPAYVPYICLARRFPSGLWALVRGSTEERKPSDYQKRIWLVS